MSRKKIDTLVVDLDNTLFDWLALWHDSFVITFREIASLVGDAAAEDAIRRIHQDRGTSEYRFLVEELLAHRSCEAEQMRDRIDRRLEELDAVRHARPYPGVPEALA